MILGIGFVGQIKTLTSVQTFYSVISGSSKKFDSEFDRIITELEEPCDVCYIDDSMLTSNIYKGLSLSNEDESVWINDQLAEYYHHSKVIKLE